MSVRVGRLRLLATFARSFLIQGSWNYHTMLGSGFAWAMLPALRAIYGRERGDLDEPFRRHLEHFNAHPYLSALALGAAVRLEADGEDPGRVRRFKDAVRGPLGSLGDALVWSAWLPAVSLAALTLVWVGVPGWVAVLAFILLYNAGHLALRAWAFRTGLREGLDVAGKLGRAHLTEWTEWIREAAAVLLGVVAGMALVGSEAVGGIHVVWGAVGVVAFVAGLGVGQSAWRPAAIGVVVVVAGVAGWGVLG